MTSVRSCAVARRRGVALLSVLWLTALIGTLSMVIATRSRAERLGLTNLVEGIRARAAADAGVEHAKAALTRSLLSTGEVAGLVAGHWAAPESLLTEFHYLGDVRYRVRLRDANARLNLHFASAEDLRLLFIALRVDAGQADRIAQAIVDWIDPDDLRHPRGAERDDYLRAGARALPRNGPLVHLDELRDVRGVSSELLATMRPHLTLVGDGRINPNVAALPVLLTLPGFTPEVASAIMQLRRRNIWVVSVAELQNALPLGVRTRLATQIGDWAPRLTFEIRQLEFESEGSLATGAGRTVVRGTFVRAGPSFLTADRRAD